MNHSEVARLALTKVAASLSTLPLITCWEAMVTGLLAHRLIESGFTLQMGTSSENKKARQPKKADFIKCNSAGEVISEKKKREVWLHQTFDRGSTDVCVTAPVIAHFEVKTGSAFGPKSLIQGAGIIGDLNRCFCTQEYDCLCFLLVADEGYYTRLKNYRPSTTNANRIALANWLPSPNLFLASESQHVTSWQNIKTEQLVIRVSSSQSEDRLVLMSFRSSHKDHTFCP